MILLEAIKYFALVWVLLSLMSEAATRLVFYFKPMRYLESPCRKCWTWWIVLILTLNPFIAALAAFFAALESNHNTIKL